MASTVSPSHDNVPDGTGSNDKGSGRDEDHPVDMVNRHDLPKSKTSAAAALALVFGLLAFFAGLTGLLAPIAVVLGVVGIIFGIVGMSRSSRPWRTGKVLAVIGLILSILALVLGVAVIAGAVTVLNDQSAVNRIEKQVDKAKDKLPTPSPTPVG